MSLKVIGDKYATNKYKREYKTHHCYFDMKRKRVRFSPMAAKMIGIKRDHYVFFFKDGDSVYIKASNVKTITIYGSNHFGIQVVCNSIHGTPYHYIKMHSEGMEQLFDCLSEEQTTKMYVEAAPIRLSAGHRELTDCYKIRPLLEGE